MQVDVFLTDFADQAVVLPIVIGVVAIVLAAQEAGRRGALTWLGVIGLTFGAWFWF